MFPIGFAASQSFFRRGAGIFSGLDEALYIVSLLFGTDQARRGQLAMQYHPKLLALPRRIAPIGRCMKHWRESPSYLNRNTIPATKRTLFCTLVVELGSCVRSQSTSKARTATRRESATFIPPPISSAML